MEIDILVIIHILYILVHGSDKIKLILFLRNYLNSQKLRDDVGSYYITLQEDLFCQIQLLWVMKNKRYTAF